MTGADPAGPPTGSMRRRRSARRDPGRRFPPAEFTPPRGVSHVGLPEGPVAGMGPRVGPRARSPEGIALPNRAGGGRAQGVVDPDRVGNSRAAGPDRVHSLPARPRPRSTPPGADRG